MCGKTEYQAIVCRTRMMTNMEQGHSWSTLCVCFCTSLYNLWEDLIIWVWTFLESELILGGLYFFKGMFEGSRLGYKVKGRIWLETWTLIRSMSHKLLTCDLNWTLTSVRLHLLRAWPPKYLEFEDTFGSLMAVFDFWAVAKAVIVHKEADGAKWTH